ncbi:MAG: hypothetical protein LIV28_09655 [Lactobacillus sp.]|nr:hypothetical protein [Lactobacillus sp.]
MMEKRWKYTDAPDIYYQDLLGAALVDELDQLNKTLQVIASNQERKQTIDIKAVENIIRNHFENLPGSILKYLD